MSESAPGFDVQAAHRYYSVDCFNKAWAIIEGPRGSLRDEEDMLSLAYTSLWHWTQRDDHARQHLAIGHWLLSRIYAMLNRPDDARYQAEISLMQVNMDSNPSPFHRAYAYEALARAEKLDGNADLAAEHKTHAEELAAKVEDEAERKLLLDDLATI